MLLNIYSGSKMHLVYPNNDEVFIIAAVYLVKEYEGELKPDYEEVSEIKWFDIDDLPDNLHQPDIEAISDIISLYRENK